MRLDNLVFRLGFAPTISAARQLVCHGHIQINGKKATIPSYQCRAGEILSVTEKKGPRTLIIQNVKNGERRRQVPTFLKVDNVTLRGTVLRLIERINVGLTLNELLIIEFYSRKV